jgi:hypothetical protein
MERLKVDGGELASIMRLIRSQIHVTIGRYLDGGPPRP